MDDLISRQAAVDALMPIIKSASLRNRNIFSTARKCMSVITELPSAQPERKGKWIEQNPKNSDKCRLIECDQCGFSHIVGFNVSYEDWIENKNFCERCGAEMREESADVG